MLRSLLPAAVGLDEFASDGEAGAAGAAGAGLVDAVEALEDALAVLGAIPGPVSLTRRRASSPARKEIEGDDAAGGGVAEGVVEEVEGDLFRAVGVALDGDLRPLAELRSDALDQRSAFLAHQSAHGGGGRRGSGRAVCRRRTA
ncbi:MAG: hypothetical protein AVDCRST_MAG19-596 [uncultured Thermomicrobiales bacterium]|uniref:Uncharacterized protein n=1 Tax=uncultured Thermomicrobiales bacterium TaxID=1645740 RepID=A0A6J4UET5_9BACT|nr:MAG: hypothetical protein AVDCRST_MAG19-596 [uncultured Thermomicrobiales bacterium]